MKMVLFTVYYTIAQLTDFIVYQVNHVKSDLAKIFFVLLGIIIFFFMYILAYSPASLYKAHDRPSMNSKSKQKGVHLMAIKLLSFLSRRPELL